MVQFTLHSPICLLFIWLWLIRVYIWIFLIFSVCKNYKQLINYKFSLYSIIINIIIHFIIFKLNDLNSWTIFKWTIFRIYVYIVSMTLSLFLPHRLSQYFVELHMYIFIYISEFRKICIESSTQIENLSKKIKLYIIMISGVNNNLKISIENDCTIDYIWICNCNTEKYINQGLTHVLRRPYLFH